VFKARLGHDWTELTATALGALRASSATLDGKAVICNADGVLDFEQLRKALAAARRRSFSTCSTCSSSRAWICSLRPYEARSQALAKLLQPVQDGITLSEHLDAEHGPEMFQAACAMGT
jgi:ATP-dependent DNA ligase